jgi:hypothetical protein
LPDTSAESLQIKDDFQGSNFGDAAASRTVADCVLNVNDANFVLRRGLAEGRQTKSMKNPTVRAADLSSAQKCTGKQSEKDSPNN